VGDGEDRDEEDAGPEDLSPGNRRVSHGVESHMRLLVAVLFCTFISSCLAADPSLTIYNQQFAVVRETVPLDLKQGINQVEFNGATALLEPDSVMLRDPSGRRVLRILEQNYRADTVSQEMLLTLNEGKTIQFEVINQTTGQNQRELVSGKIIRSGLGVPQGTMSWYGPVRGSGEAQPVIEVDGKLRFSLPGQPLFPALADDSGLCVEALGGASLGEFGGQSAQFMCDALTLEFDCLQLNEGFDERLHLCQEGYGIGLME